MQKLTQQCLISAGLIALSSTANAVDTQPQESYPHQQSLMYLSVGTIGIDKKLAGVEKIGDSATTFRFGYESQTGNFVWGAGLSGLFYDDKAKINVDLENISTGKRKNENSDATAYGIYGELGYRHSFNEKVAATFVGGYDLTLSSERGFANCSNCPSEDINVDAGLFIAPRVDFQFTDNFLMQLSYQNYLSGDLSSGLMLTFAYSYW